MRRSLRPLAVLALTAPLALRAETVLLIPAAANASGRGGVHWRTTLELINPSKSASVEVSVSFLAAGADNRGAHEVTRHVPTGGQVVLPDVVGELLGATGGGALRLRAPAEFHAVSRTDTPRPGSLPAGVEIPAVTSEREAASGVLFPLAHRAGDSGTRTNVGFVNPGFAPVTVSYTLFDAALSRLGSGSAEMPPLGFVQVSDLFGALGAEDPREDARLEFHASAPVHGFAIVLSNATGEGSYVAANPGAAAVPGVGVTSVATVTPVPDAAYKTANFCRLFRLPGTERFVLTFGTGDYTRVGPSGCADAGMGYAWKELDGDLASTGRSAMFRSYPGSCAAGDAASVLVGSDYYFLTGAPGGLTLARYDVATFTKKGERSIPLEKGREADNDQMLAFVDGKLDASALLAPASNAEVDPFAGFGTYHKLFTPELSPAGETRLTDPAHINGSSMMFRDGAYTLVTSTAFFGDLVALRYDRSFAALGRRFLASRGQWSEGAVWDGRRYWVTWVDVSRRGTANILLGAFDEDWSPVSRVVVTAFTPANGLGGGRPALLLEGSRIFVAYDVESADPVTHEEKKDWGCRISTYDVGP